MSVSTGGSEAGGLSAATERLQRVARGSALNLAGAAVSSSAGFALTVVLTRTLSRPDAGVFFSATALFLLATGVGQLGTSTGLVYFLSRARARGRAAAASSYMRTAMGPVLVVALVMGVAVFVLAGPVAGVMGPGHAGELTSYLRVLAVFIPCAAVANLSLSGTRGMGTMRPGALLDQMSRPTLQLVLVVAVTAVSADHLVPEAWALPYLPLAVLGWLAWRRASRRGADEGAAPLDAGPASVFWRFTAPRAVSSVAQLAMQRFDIILVGGIAGVSQAAVYAATSRFLALGQLAGGAISQAVQPHLGEALAADDQTSLADLYKTSTGWLVALTWPLYLVFIVAAPTILQIFGHGYGGGRGVLIILAASMLVATGCGMVDMVLLMAGRSSWNLYNVLVSFTVNLGVDLLLIPRLGILGAAIGWALAILAANLLPLVQVVMSTKVHPFGTSSLAAMVASVGCLAAVPETVRLVAGPDWRSVALGVGLGAALYAACLWRLRHVLRLAGLASLRRRHR